MLQRSSSLCDKSILLKQAVAIGNPLQFSIKLNSSTLKELSKYLSLAHARKALVLDMGGREFSGPFDDGLPTATFQIQTRGITLYNGKIKLSSEQSFVVSSGAQIKFKDIEIKRDTQGCAPSPTAGAPLPGNTPAHGVAVDPAAMPLPPLSLIQVHGEISLQNCKMESSADQRCLFVFQDGRANLTGCRMVGGVTAEGSNSIMDASESQFHGNLNSGPLLLASQGALLRLDGSYVIGARKEGVSVTGSGSSGHLVRTEIRNCAGSGCEVSQGASVQLADSRIHSCAGYAFVAAEIGSRGEIQNSRIHGDGMGGLLSRNGGALDLEACIVAGCGVKGCARCSSAASSSSSSACVASPSLPLASVSSLTLPLPPPRGGVVAAVGGAMPALLRASQSVVVPRRAVGLAADGRGAEVSAAGCKFQCHPADGVRLTAADGRYSFVDCVFSANGGLGCRVVGDGTSIELERCKVVANGATGLSVGDGANVQGIKSQFTQNAGMGFSVVGSSDLVELEIALAAKKNAKKDNKSGGKGDGSKSATEKKIGKANSPKRGAKKKKVVALLTSSTFTGCVSSENGQDGVGVMGEGKLALDDCHLFSNGGSGIVVKSMSSAALQGGFASGNSTFGVLAENGGNVTLEKTQVYRNLGTADVCSSGPKSFVSCKACVMDRKPTAEKTATLKLLPLLGLNDIS